MPTEIVGVWSPTRVSQSNVDGNILVETPRDRYLPEPCGSDVREEGVGNPLLEQKTSLGERKRPRGDPRAVHIGVEIAAAKSAARDDGGSVSHAERSRCEFWREREASGHPSSMPMPMLNARRSSTRRSELPE